MDINYTITKTYFHRRTIDLRDTIKNIRTSQK